VEGKSIHAVVRIQDRDHRRLVGDEIAGRLLAMLPGLERHSCESGSAHGIVAELTDTETAHALEHLTLEIMALAGSPRSLRGLTEWDFARDGKGVFRVSVDYDRDDVAVGAIRVARDVLEWVMGQGASVDIETAVTRLWALRG